MLPDAETLDRYEKSQFGPVEACFCSAYYSAAGVCANKCRVVNMHSAWEARIRRRFDFIKRKGMARSIHIQRAVV